MVDQEKMTAQDGILNQFIEFSTIKFLKAVLQRAWRSIVGMRGNRKLQDVRRLKDLYRHAQRGLQVYLEGIDYPLMVSWFWFKPSQGKGKLRFVVYSHPYSGVYLVPLWCKWWAIEGFLQIPKPPSTSLDCTASVNPPS
ncbi:MAG: hypothetical protein NW224_05760 [Leptolyngbyaceae cyanobacterium bins.302]|nr:hypothetical protein [Leptolyngbyaceae cyanobacterium bins.302]